MKVYDGLVVNFDRKMLEHDGLIAAICKLIFHEKEL